MSFSSRPPYKHPTANQGVRWLFVEAVNATERKRKKGCLHFSVICEFVCLLQHHFSKELSGLAPMMLGSGRELKQSWENEINQGGSTSALVPPLHLATSFSLYLDPLSISLLCESTLFFESEMIKKHNCHSKEFKLMSRANCTLFLVKTTIMGGWVVSLPRVTSS